MWFFKPLLATVLLAGPDALPRTGVDGLGTVLFAALAITGLGVLCLVVGFKVSRREEE